MKYQIIIDLADEATPESVKYALNVVQAALGDEVDEVYLSEIIELTNP